MKAIFIISLIPLISHALCSIAADDIRSKVGSTGRERLSRLEIDPDAHIYGIPFGASEDEFIKAHGKPMGYVRLNDTHTALIYGQSHAFVFASGNLMGVRITSQILDWKLVNDFQDRARFDSRDWRLNSGVFLGMNLKQVRKILGDKLATNELRHRYYLTTKARVDLDFSHYTNQGDGDEAYHLHGIYVRQGAPGGDAVRVPRDGRLNSNSPGGSERFGGIGAVLRVDEETGKLEIVRVTTNSPADRAGLHKGMLIRSIDGVPTDGMNLSESVELLRGAVGTKLKVEVFDTAADQSRVVELIREEIVFNWLGGLTNITVTTEQALRLETTNGARAVIHFFGFTSGGFGSGDREDTVTYRWQFRASPSAPIVAGTNTAVDRYTSELIGANRFERKPRNSREAAKIKAGEFAVDWSYGYTNKGFIRFDSSKLKASLDDRSAFDRGP